MRWYEREMDTIHDENKETTFMKYNAKIIISWIIIFGIILLIEHWLTDKYIISHIR